MLTLHCRNRFLAAHHQKPPLRVILRMPCLSCSGFWAGSQLLNMLVHAHGVSMNI